MPAYAENGLTIAWTAATAAADGAVRVIATASPPHPANVMRAACTVDGGPEQIVRGFPLDPGVLGPTQRFAIDLPPVAPGRQLSWRPILSCSGREADPRRGGVPAETITAPPSHAAPGSHEGAPSDHQTTAFGHGLEFLARVTAPLEKTPEVVGETPEGLRIVWPLAAGGTVRGPRLNGAILHHGGDWMLIRRDGIGVPSVRVLIRTDRGETIQGGYSGVVDFGADGYERLRDNRPPAHAWTQLAPKYTTAAKGLQWLNRVQCAAFGWVTFKTLLVEYDLYALRGAPRPAA